MKESKRKVRFIVNPISGTQSKKEIPSQIERLIDHNRYEVEISPTAYRGHAEELSRDAAQEGYYAVIAVGGDGTVNEVARGLLHTNTALGIIPCGSGNGLARHIHIPIHVPKAISIINEGLAKQIDYGLMNDTPFFCTCGVGFDALVCQRFTMDGKRGLLTYMEKALTEFLKYKPETYEVETEEGTQKHKAFLITCCNASQYGNNAFISPYASLHDGLLDISIMKPFTMMDVPQIVFQLFNKMIAKNSRIESFRCKELIIHRKSEGVAHYDGDPILLGADIRIRVVKRGLSVLSPRKVEYPAIEQVQGFLNPMIEEVTAFNRQTMARNMEFLKSLFWKAPKD